MSTFIVTGASSGIGRAVAVALAQRHVDVLAVARRVERLAELEQLHAPHIRGLSADLGTKIGIDKLMSEASTLEQIDGIVHAAGSVVPLAGYSELRAEELTSHFTIHVATPIEINNQLGRRLHGRRIVFIDSYSAKDPRPGWCGYSIIKSAAQIAARAAAAELNAHVIRVFPGGVRTELVEAVLDAPQSSPTKQVFTDMDDAGTLIDPNMIGEFIVRIALDASSEELDAREFWDFAEEASS